MPIERITIRDGQLWTVGEARRVRVRQVARRVARQHGRRLLMGVLIDARGFEG